MFENPFEEFDVLTLPEDSYEEKIVKIKALAIHIRNDWNDPRNKCRKIIELCDKLLEL